MVEAEEKGCELFFPDGQRVIVESRDPENNFVETLTEAIASAHGAKTFAPTPHDDVKHDDESVSDSVFTQSGVAQTTTPTVAPATTPSTSKTPVVTREVIIESLKRAQQGEISPLAIKQWAMKVRDCKIIDADEAMVGYILFSLSRLELDNETAVAETMSEFYERLTVTLV